MTSGTPRARFRCQCIANQDSTKNHKVRRCTALDRTLKTEYAPCACQRISSMRKFHNRDFVWVKITNPVVARVFGIFANRCLSYRTPIGGEVFSLRATPPSGPARELHHYAPDARCCPGSSCAAPGGEGTARLWRSAGANLGHGKGECSALQARSRLSGRHMVDNNDPSNRLYCRW